MLFSEIMPGDLVVFQKLVHDLIDEQLYGFDYWNVLQFVFYLIFRHNLVIVGEHWAGKQEH